MLAPVLVALWAAGTIVQGRGLTPKAREYALLAACAGAAVFATPLGYRLPVYALELLHSPIRAAITEWQPSGLSDVSFTIGALALILATCVLGFERSRRWPEIFVFAAVTWLALTAVRNVPVCAIVLAPAVAARLSARMSERARVNALFAERPVRALFFCGTTLAALVSAAAIAVSPQFRTGNLPEAAITRLASLEGTHRLYCEDFAWCSLALAHPNLQEFIDGRCDPFPLAVWNDYITIFHAKRGWHDVVERRGIDAILVDKKRGLARKLPLWQGWSLVYADGEYRLFVRSGTRSTAYKQ
jgi:hypothetical protein